MNKAFDWQSGDKKWSNMFDGIAKACGITTDDFDIKIMKAKQSYFIMKKSNDKKGYWVAKANVNSPEKQQNYGKLAEAVLEKFKGKFLIRGGRQVTKEGEEYMRNVVVEFPSYKDAIDAYESKEYQDALKVLDGGAERLYAVVEGY